jgi:short-subunit dehydrogenase
VTQKVALVTGASSGIGRATALAFARQGIHVAGVARRTDRLAEIEAEIAPLPGEFLALTGDVTQAESMRSAVQQTIKHFGRLDYVIANAGIGQRGAVADADWQDIETVLRTNIDGVLHTVRAAVPALRESGGGHIVTVSSIVYNLVSPYAATYAASKAFVTSMAHSLRLELEDDNIGVTDVLVGRTHTEFNEKRLGTGKRNVEGIPTMSPERVADAILRAVERKPRSVTVRWFDRLVILGNMLLPDVVGRMARKQYK